MGRKKRPYVTGDGIRHRFREALEASRGRFPRKGLVHHERSWFLSDMPARRPVFGVYALAAFGEDMLWRAKFARKGMAPPVEDALVFFAETRRALQNVLSAYRIDRRLTPAQADALRRVVARLQDSARTLLEKMKKVSRPHLTPAMVI